MEEPTKYQCLTALLRRSLEQKIENENCSKAQTLRLQIILLADQGISQREICKMLGCSRSTARYWTLIAHAGKVGCWENSSQGRPTRINNEYLKRLKELLGDSPRNYGYAFQRWTVSSLRSQLTKELGISTSERNFKRIMKRNGLSTRSIIDKIEV